MNNIIRDKLRQLSNKEIAAHDQKFFKTGKGEYGYGDVFLGVRVPLLRKLVKEHKEISKKEALILLRSKFHEERMVALFMLIKIYNTAEKEEKKNIYELYLSNTKFINNWDLVDCSAEHIVGAYLWQMDRTPIYTLAGSKKLWERRIAIISTFYFIKRNDFQDALKISEILLNDHEDLIHKAIGWMLREIGKRDILTEENFLMTYYRNMPRTMLRYAIEKFPESKRKCYLSGLL